MNLEAQMTIETFLQTAIRNLISYEPHLDAKLDLLSAITTTTQNDHVWQAAEEIRSDICSNPHSENILKHSEDSGVAVGQEREDASDVLHSGHGHEDAGSTRKASAVVELLNTFDRDYPELKLHFLAQLESFTHCLSVKNEIKAKRFEIVHEINGQDYGGIGQGFDYSTGMRF